MKMESRYYLSAKLTCWVSYMAGNEGYGYLLMTEAGDSKQIFTSIYLSRIQNLKKRKKKQKTQRGN